MNSLVLSCLDESSSFLQITRTAIKAWMGFEFSKIERGSTELDAFGRLKIRHRLIKGVM